MNDAITFFVGLAFMLGGSWTLPPLIDWVGERFDVPDGLVGLLVALAADSPELSSAVVALVHNDRSVSVGVIFGSNIFNLATLIGVSAVIAGKVSVQRRPLLVHGSVSLIVTLLAVGVVTNVLSGVVVAALLISILLPYVVVLATAPREIANLPLPRALSGWLARSVGESQREAAASAIERRDGDETSPRRLGGGVAAVLALGSLSAVIGGSTATVASAIDFGRRWHVPSAVVGAVVLAALTGIPNVYTAVSMAKKGYGRAVVSETFNSNTVNVVVGASIPAILIGTSALSKVGDLSIYWLVAMTLVTVAIGSRQGGFTRTEGVALLLAYGGFVAVMTLAA